MAVRAFILDAQGLLRECLREIPLALDWLSIVGESQDGRQARDEIERLQPDLLFLDIDLPGVDGISLLRQMSVRPQVVVTASDGRCAVEAFELDAIDYLIKPLAAGRLSLALQRARQRFLPDVAVEAPRRLFVQREDRLVPIQLEDISHIEAFGDYVYLHSGGRSDLVHLSLKQMRDRLKSDRFLQVHRSHLVNLDHVEALRSHDDRRYCVALRDGTEVIASRAGSMQLRSMLA